MNVLRRLTRTSHLFTPKARKKAWMRRLREPNGNMGFLVFACTLGIMTALACFCLGIMRLAGSNHEQRTAIEAAALRAAMDLTRIVIFTPQYGYVGLSDSAPSGSYTNTSNGDGYSMPVHGINTLLATARLNLMIAVAVPNAQEQGNANPATYHYSYPDPLLQALALNDLANVYAAQTQLQAALNDAVLASPTKGPYYDVNGDQINVYSDALGAYQANPIRMTGRTNLVAGSLKLTPGYLTQPMATNIVVLQGLTDPLRALPTTQRTNGFYNAYVDCPFTPPGGMQTDFYFAGIGNTVKLVDKNYWVATLPNLPSTLPQPPLASIIKAEADQSFAASSASFNGGVIHAMACASPANVVDPKPSPGSFKISFSDGQISEFTSLQDIFGNQQMN